MAIDFDGVDSLFEYSNKIQELANEVHRFRNNSRTQLSQEERATLKSYEYRLRRDATTIATDAGIDLLTRLQPQLAILKEGIEKADSLLQNIDAAKDVISAITEVFTAVTNVFALLK
ncbi:MAG: hypothetical protein V7L25_27920 [Nostoc sp.]|uniref:hypothetical protein n=1 Tax=Nostoc sp. TaxID=1180 RepID=UPI002FF16054